MKNRLRPPCNGFTLIELLVVLAVVLILLGLALPGLAENLRRSAVREVAGDILVAAEQARQSALQANGTGHEAYGVRIHDEQGGTALVTLMALRDGAVVPVTDPAGEPIYERRIPSSVVLWAGGSDLRSQSDATIEWWYLGGSGRLVQRDGGRFLPGTASVGLPARPLSEVWGIAANSGTPPAIAQGDLEAPGLAVRSSDRRYGVAIVVHPGGLASSYEIGEDR